MPLPELLPKVEDVLRKAGIWDEAFAQGGARREWFEETVDLIRPRFITLLDFAEAGRAYFDDRFDMDPEAVEKNLGKEPRLQQWLPDLAERFEQQGAFDPASAEAALRAYADERGVKAGVLINAVRTAVTGRSVGASLFQILGCLGRERVARRLRDAAPDVSAGP
jgi:glutamyl-tRNA synthetase